MPKWMKKHLSRFQEEEKSKEATSGGSVTHFVVCSKTDVLCPDEWRLADIAVPVDFHGRASDLQLSGKRLQKRGKGQVKIVLLEVKSLLGIAFNPNAAFRDGRRRDIKPLSQYNYQINRTTLAL